MSISKMLRSFCFLLLLISGPGFALEKILDYHSDVQIQQDGSIEVSETIRVNAEGNNIRRGIYRDFPTSYTDKRGNYYKVDFEVLSVTRDDRPEPWHSDTRVNGVRTYIGSENVRLSPGQYTYRLSYKTTRQIGFFDDYDELYWNVTGNGWMFPIDHASATISIPESIDSSDFRTAFYTGSSGSTAQNARSQILSGQSVEFETTRGLEPYEGLTVAVGWPKGLINQPGTQQKILWFFKDNGSATALLLGLLAAFGWYYRSWKTHGKDPKKGVIIPLFEPPDGISPAGVSYIDKMRFNKRTFPAAIISLAVKGYLEIHEDKKDFELIKKPAAQAKQGGADELSPGEKAVYHAVFSKGSPAVLKQKNYAVFTKAKSALQSKLKAEHFGQKFKTNGKYALPAIGITILSIIIAANLQGGPLPWIIFVIAAMFMHITFIILMRAPTPGGRKIMDQIEGFKMYLDTAEQDRLQRMRSPALTPEVFESFLPYAFALGVENTWCERFANEFPEELAEQNGYNPAWYAGRHSGLNSLKHMGNNFSSNFSSAVSSSSTPPGSSSGSGGGGSSGGGGGGGGGGGW